MSLRIFVMENGNLEATMRTVWTYLESHVYDQWDTELQEFFMDISIVKDFTVSLAAMITGNKHVEHMLAQGMETGKRRCLALQGCHALVYGTAAA